MRGEVAGLPSQQLLALRSASMPQPATQPAAATWLDIKDVLAARGCNFVPEQRRATWQDIAARLQNAYILACRAGLLLWQNDAA
jgi:hypothetical protein